MQIFLSYSRQNADQIQLLVEDLEALGHDVWYDHEISGGQAWWNQILENIRNCNLFVFALSPHSLDSRPCRLECSYAFSLNKHILPVMIADDVAAATLPEELSVIQFIDYRQPDKQAAITLGRSLANLPPEAQPPDPLPEPPPVPISYLGRLKDRIETEATLSFEEQAALILELRQHLTQNAEKEQVRDLLQRLRQRNELFTKISDEIDSLLASAELVPSPPQRSQEEKKKPERGSSLPSQTRPPLTASPVPQTTSTRIKPTGRLGIAILIVVAWFVVSTVVYTFGKAQYFGWLAYGFVDGLPTNLIVFLLPGLVMAVLFWLRFRGRR